MGPITVEGRRRHWAGTAEPDGSRPAAALSPSACLAPPAYIIPLHAAVLHADTLPQIFEGKKGPSGGCYL